MTLSVQRNVRSSVLVRIGGSGRETRRGLVEDTHTLTQQQKVGRDASALHRQKTFG